MFQGSPKEQHNGFLIMRQGESPEHCKEVSPGRWRMEIGPNTYYSKADKDNVRHRAELALKTPMTIGQVHTFSYTIERNPEEFPIYEGGRESKLCCGQGFVYDVGPKKDDRPPFWYETLGKKQGVFLNSYVGGPKGLVETGEWQYGRQRICWEVIPYANGKCDVCVRSDGKIIYLGMDIPFEQSLEGIVFIFKVGLYMNRQGKHDPNMPTIAAYFERISFHVGVATSDDVYDSVPQNPEPVPVDTDVDVVEPKPTDPPAEPEEPAPSNPVPGPTDNPDPVPPQTEPTAPPPTAEEVAKGAAYAVVAILKTNALEVGRVLRNAGYTAEVDDMDTIRRMCDEVRTKMQRVDREAK